ncbi:ATP-binding protein [Streptomyces tendae]
MPRKARGFTRQAANSWRLPQDKTDDLLLIVSELATNAFSHTASPTAIISAVLMPASVVVGVASRGPSQQLVATAADCQAEGGRGLFIVRALAQEWGLLQTSAGLRVWARVSLSEERAVNVPRQRSDPDTLPRRMSDGLSFLLPSSAHDSHSLASSVSGPSGGSRRR